MEHMEIILVNVNKSSIDGLVFEELRLRDAQVSGSHFYDNKIQTDVKLEQIDSLSEVLSPKGTGNIVVDCLMLGTQVNSIVIVFSFDKVTGDVVFNFPETEIFLDDLDNARTSFRLLLLYLLRLKERFEIPKIVIGFEPAIDVDCCLLEIGENPIDVDKAVDMILK